MKAIVIHEFGPPDVLKYQDIPDPQPREGEIRIRVHAATVNRVLDVSVRAGREGARGPVLPLIPGVDCAGVVDAVGTGRAQLAARHAGRGRRRDAAEDRRRGWRGLFRTDGHDGHQAARRLRRARLRPGLRGDRTARAARLSPRGGGDAPCADRLEPAVPCRRAEGRRNHPGHGRGRQSRLDRHPDRQERDRRDRDRGRRLGRARAGSASTSAPTMRSTTTPTTCVPR